MAAYYFAKWLSAVCCLLPDGLLELAGRALGLLTWPLIPAKRRRMARENVARCLGVADGEAARIAKASWVRFGPMFFEVMRFPKWKGRLSERVEIEGAAHLEKVLALGRGAVIATSHGGNWELMGAALSEAGYPIVAVGMRQKEAGFDRFITETRRAMGMHVTYKDDVREMFAMMKRGWVIGLLMDQDVSRRDGIVLPWFGRPTNVVQGPAVFGRFQNVPIVPGYITRLSDGRHKIILHPPVPVERTRDKRADIRRAMEAVGRALESHIRAHPEEWFWLHDRWKSVRGLERADGAPR